MRFDDVVMKRVTLVAARECSLSQSLSMFWKRLPPEEPKMKAYFFL